MGIYIDPKDCSVADTPRKMMAFAHPDGRKKTWHYVSEKALKDVGALP